LNTLIILSALGLIGLFSEIFGFRKILLPIIYVGLVVALGATVYDWNTNLSFFNDMVRFDNYALSFSALIIFISLIWFVISPAYFHEPTSETDHATLIIFALIGGVLMASYSNMIMLFLGLEILSISMYILAGSNKSSLSSNEAALKYFLMGSFATCFLLFGIALLYGSTGSFNLDAIANALSTGKNEIMVFTGVMMMMVAMAFKVSAAPFHFWAPDVYQGSPTVITAFMSTVVKTAAFAAFLRLFMTSFGSIPSVWFNSLWVISALTILIGNITAVFQSNVKRMLAYSSISHAGYMILAILAMNNSSAGSLLFYTVAYSISSITSFAILLVVSNKTGNENIDSFNGLAKRNPLLAAATVVAMLSLAGIPPTAGFFAKYFIFSAAIQNNLTPLVLIAVVGSLIGVFYYFRIIIALFRDKESEKIEMNAGYKAALLLTSVIALVLGVLPGLLTSLL
jgi:NADH-quinone oxidoreductase subunit N